MAKKGEFVLELRAEELGISLDKMGTAIEAGMSEALENVANAAFAKAMSVAQAQLHTQRQEYVKALKLDKIGPDMWILTLEGDYANKLEEGYGGYDMKQKMLASSKTVEAGKRTGQPWVQMSKKGKKFAHVPFGHKPFSGAPEGKDMAEMIRSLMAQNAQGQMQSIAKIFKDVNGNPIDSGSGINSTAVARISSLPDAMSDAAGKKLQGMVKYQKVTTNEATGKQTVQSIYHTYRTVSEDSAGWQHPGFAGIHAFAEVEKMVAEELDNIIKRFLG